ncbi:MAG: aminoglycoside phosphotransferase family protein [Rhodospirillales bacterium]
MTPELPDRQTRLARTLTRLQEISRQRFGCNAAPYLLTDKGLAHDHVAMPGTGLLFRVPKQSQMEFAAADNLAFQAECFRRAAASGAAPAVHDIVEPDEVLPFGALVVEHVEGRPARLPADLPAIADCLAAIHALPLPGECAPLGVFRNALAGILAEVGRQAEHLDHPGVPAASRRLIREEISDLGRDAATGAAALCLITFDAHPGNYLIRPDGSAVIVDLEKMRYSAPGFDLAHASLYTSTTWDIETRAELAPAEAAGFYRAWLAAVPPGLRDAARPGLVAERRGMWLWSVTWCARWLAESAGGADHGSTRDWSKHLSDDVLTRHVADRVADYLSPDSVERVREDWRQGGWMEEFTG